MTFEAFLESKKIDPICWQNFVGAEAARHKAAYESLGPVAFFQRYLFLINRWRHVCPLRTSG